MRAIELLTPLAGEEAERASCREQEVSMRRAGVARFRSPAVRSSPGSRDSPAACSPDSPAEVAHLQPAISSF